MCDSCEKFFDAVDECRRKHPRQTVVCMKLVATAGWCVFGSICPDQVSSLESCCEKAGSTAYMRAGPPPNIPPTCHEQVLQLEACLASHQASLDQRDKDSL